MRNLLFLPLFLLAGRAIAQPPIVHRTVDPTNERISFHWKGPDGRELGNIAALRDLFARDSTELRFAMNGGMYTTEQAPVGLYVENGRILHPIDRRPDGKDNFHMQPNGVFGLYTDGRPFIRTTPQMEHVRDVQFATQSGPMLVIDGRINNAFTPGSRNLNIRNGVGLLPDGRVLFAISTQPVNFHDFASWFLEQGCREALYLDGFVSRAYIPEAGLEQLDGAFGVLIAVRAR